MKTFREFSNDCHLSINEGALKSLGLKVANANPRLTKKVVNFVAPIAQRVRASYNRVRFGNKVEPVNVRDLGNAAPPTTSPGGGKPPSGLSTKPTTTIQPSIKPTANPLKGLKSGSVLSGVIDTALEKSSGSGWLRSLAKGTTTALGTLAGGAAGSAAGPVGTFAGGTAGGMAASAAFDTVAGKNAVERAADRLKNRQGQSGGALKGIGGKTSFDTKKNTMTTGSGSQKKTVNLAKTSVVKDPTTGKVETGNLAYKGGKAVYKRADAPGTGTSNPFERIGRAINPDAYKANDAKLAAQKLKQAASSDIARQQALGVKGSKNLVGPKIVGPKK